MLRPYTPENPLQDIDSVFLWREEILPDIFALIYNHEGEPNQDPKYWKFDNFNGDWAFSDDFAKEQDKITSQIYVPGYWSYRKDKNSLYMSVFKSFDDLVNYLNPLDIFYNSQIFVRNPEGKLYKLQAKVSGIPAEE